MSNCNKKIVKTTSIAVKQIAELEVRIEKNSGKSTKEKTNEIIVDN